MFLIGKIPELPDGNEVKIYIWIIYLLIGTIVTLAGVIVYKDTQVKTATNEHKNDLRLFDGENKKLREKLLDVLNKIQLAMSEMKLENSDLKRQVSEMIMRLTKRGNDE